ncbi:MAG: hypothetical protein J6Z82_02610 [Schwartzia sp.]|nr:hypothetical protein [Schwartzia sp. (in: firmicutes)]
MTNTKLSSAAHGLNVMKTLMPTLTSKAQNASSGMSFAETLISVRTRVQTVSVTTTNTSTEMTMTEYQEYIWGKIDSFPFSPTRPYDEEAIKISEKCWNRMKDDPEYEEKMMNIIKDGRQYPDPFFGMGSSGTYCIMEFDGGEGCHSHTFSKNFGGSRSSASSLFDRESEGSFWSNRHERHKEHMKQAAQRLLEHMHAMQAETRHVRVTRLTVQAKYCETTSVAGAALPASEMFSGLGGLGISL